MNILFITQDDPFYITVFFENFLKTYPSLDEIKGVVLCKTMGKGRFELVKQLYNFYGLHDFIRMTGRYIRFKFLGYLCGKLQINRFYDLRQLLHFYNIPIIYTDEINSKEFLDEMASYNLDLIISVACPKIFRENLLCLPRFGCINIHTAKLPKYRGMMPNFWNMYNNEKTTGITIHKINAGIDDGEIILQKDVIIYPEECLDALIKKTKKVGAYIMIEAIHQIKEGTIQYIENDGTKSSYYSFPTEKDIKEFRKLGKRLL